MSEHAPWPAKFGETLFKLRDYTPIPLILLLLFTAKPSAKSATIGLLLIVLGELIRMYAVAYIGSVSRTRNTETTGGKLIDQGPFAIVRNPLYVGNFFITAGVAVYGGHLGVVILGVALFAFQYFCIVSYEESLLVRKFGGEYEDYRHRVPQWFPKRAPNLGELPMPDSLSGAWKSEKRTLSAIGALILVLFFLS